MIHNYQDMFCYDELKTTFPSLSCKKGTVIWLSSNWWDIDCQVSFHFNFWVILKGRKYIFHTAWNVSMMARASAATLSHVLEAT